MKSELFELTDIPQCDVGAPVPKLECDEFNLKVRYYLQRYTEGEEDRIAKVNFRLVHVFQFGAPNEEAINGHPLYSLGLRPCACYLVKGSSWISEYEKRNSVHPYHNKKEFEKLNHYIWTFHDTTLEVMAQSFSYTIEGAPNKTKG